MDTTCHMNATLKGANLHPGVIWHPGANLHPCANCAYVHDLSNWSKCPNNNLLVSKVSLV